MMLTTVMPKVRCGGYDSPSSNKDAPEVNDGEYIVLYNVSNDTLDLGAYRLKNVLNNTSWTMSGLGTLASTTADLRPSQRIMIGNYPDSGVGGFKTLSLITDELLREGDVQLVGGLGITLPDSAGSIVLEDTSGNVNDRLNYGEYFALQAENVYVSAVNLDSLEKRGPLNAVYRTAGLSRPVGGRTPQVLVISTTGTLSGVPAISPLPGGYTGAESGSYVLERGGKAYEFNNHLGNVLAIISDKKLGQDTGTDDIAEYYEPEVRMLTDYYPFGSPMVGRSWESGAYRYGFNGMQKDNEVVGEGNGYDFGARLYDGRVGRWWSVDPMAGKYPFFSPYQVLNSNPICIIDPTGKSGEAVIDKESRTVTVTSVFGFYGSQVSAELARETAKTIEKAYNDAKGKINIDGVLYSVQFKVIGLGFSSGGNEQIENMFKDEIEKNEDIRFNFVRLEAVSDDWFGGDSYTDNPKALGLGSNSGYWSKNQLIASGGTTGAHEYNHSLGGLNNPEKINPNGGKRNMTPSIDMTSGSYKFTSEEFEIVDEECNPSMDVTKRRVHQENISSIFTKDIIRQLKSSGKSDLGILTNKYHEK